MDWGYILFGEVTLLDFLTMIIIIIAGVLIGKAIQIRIRRSLKDKVDKSSLESGSKVIYYLIVIITLIIALPMLKFDLTGLVLAGGIFAIVIGFASQSIVGNLISGLFLMAERPIKIGDSVNIDGNAGTVEEVLIMSTRVRLFDGVHVRIPNETVFTSNIVNYFARPARRLEYTIGIRYKDDASNAIEIIKNIIEEHQLTLVNPEPQVFVDNLGDNSVNIIVRAWAPSTEWYPIKMELLWKIKKTLEENGIQIPFPQRELWFNDKLEINSKKVNS